MKLIEIKSNNNTDTMVFVDRITHITETKKGCDIFFGDYKLETSANYLDVKNAVYEQIARYERRLIDAKV